MIPTILLILPITALLVVTISALVPISVFWAAVDFLIKLRIRVKASTENIPENDLGCKSFSYLPLLLPTHRESH
jgi:hypothetical protein